MSIGTDRVSIFTDGSCNPTLGIGGWASIVLIGEGKVVLSGLEARTTHQCMELTAAIKAIEYVLTLSLKSQHILLYTDSQYLVSLPGRRGRLVAAGWMTKGNLPVRNGALVQRVLALMDLVSIEIIKVKAHARGLEESAHNREADKLSRKIIRDSVRNPRPKHWR